MFKGECKNLSMTQLLDEDVCLLISSYLSENYKTESSQDSEAQQGRGDLIPRIL